MSRVTKSKRKPRPTPKKRPRKPRSSDQVIPESLRKLPFEGEAGQCHRFTEPDYCAHGRSRVLDCPECIAPERCVHGVAMSDNCPKCWRDAVGSPVAEHRIDKAVIPSSEFWPGFGSGVLCSVACWAAWPLVLKIFS